MNNLEKKGGGWFFISVVFLLLGLLTLIDSIGPYRVANAPEPPLPPWIPEDLPMIFGEVDAADRAYLVYCNRDTQLRVEFEGRNSIKGWWRGSNPTFLVNAPYFQTLAATTNSDSWGIVILSDDVDSFTPWLEVTLSVDPKYYHTWMSASANLDIVYPASSGATFSNQNDHFEREVQLFVITDKDIEMQEARASWERVAKYSWSDLWSMPTVFLSIAILGFVAGIFFRLRPAR